MTPLEALYQSSPHPPISVMVTYLRRVLAENPHLACISALQVRAHLQAHGVLRVDLLGEGLDPSHQLAAVGLATLALTQHGYAVDLARVGDPISTLWARPRVSLTGTG